MIFFQNLQIIIAIKNTKMLWITNISMIYEEIIKLIENNHRVRTLEVLEVKNGIRIFSWKAFQIVDTQYL